MYMCVCAGLYVCVYVCGRLCACSCARDLELQGLPSEKVKGSLELHPHKFWHGCGVRVPLRCMYGEPVYPCVCKCVVLCRVGRWGAGLCVCACVRESACVLVCWGSRAPRSAQRESQRGAPAPPAQYRRTCGERGPPRCTCGCTCVFACMRVCVRARVCRVGRWGAGLCVCGACLFARMRASVRVHAYVRVRWTCRVGRWGWRGLCVNVRARVCLRACVHVSECRRKCARVYL